MAIHWKSGHTSRSANWWIGMLFAIGSVCFLVGPFPGFIDLVGSAADGMVFFVGSIFFTSAAFLQFRHSEGKDRDRDGDSARRHRVLQHQHVPRDAGQLRQC